MTFSYNQGTIGLMGRSTKNNLKAVYENGKLVPLEPVGLKEHQHVTLRLLEKDESNEQDEGSRYELVSQGDLLDAASIEVRPDRSTTRSLHGVVANARYFPPDTNGVLSKRCES